MDVAPLAHVKGMTPSPPPFDLSVVLALGLPQLQAHPDAGGEVDASNVFHHPHFLRGNEGERLDIFGQIFVLSTVKLVLGSEVLKCGRSFDNW